MIELGEAIGIAIIMLMVVGLVITALPFAALVWVWRLFRG